MSKELINDEVTRLIVLAVKHCPNNHHDWEEIKGLLKKLDLFQESLTTKQTEQVK